MAGKTKNKEETGKTDAKQVMFKCTICEKEKPIQEMRSVTRFVPALVVCEACAKTLR
jgi:hypothetical protein